MSAFALRMLAIVLMVLDHTAVLAADGMPDAVYLLLRMLGRMAFPIFAYLTANGYRHTHSLPRYALRFLVWALVSECAFDLAFAGTWWNPSSQNVFLTLLLGLLAIALYDAASRRLAGGRFLGAAGVLLCGVAAEFLQTDYGLSGVLLIAAFHILGETPRGRVLACLVFGFRKVGYFALRQLAKFCLGRTDIAFLPARWDLVTIAAAGALIPLLVYDGRRGYTPASRAGKIAVQTAAYAFYPLHLLVLALLFRF